MRLGVYVVSLEKKPLSRERSARRLLESVSSRGYHLAKINGFISKVWFPTRPNASQVTLLGGTTVRKMRLHKWDVIKNHFPTLSFLIDFL